ncbi:hypothetical protein [Psychrobacter immobilis]|uniref:hypothetical protein n=1 Tax=Psychrobacter immobilis TaxID=498 RepID=UPI0019199EEA|nr:hypothetical protein [Psychrobacter immobilis]
MLITELGYFALLAALILAILQVVLPTIGVMRDHVAWHRVWHGHSLPPNVYLLVTPVRDKPHCNSLILFTMSLPVPAEACF